MEYNYAIGNGGRGFENEYANKGGASMQGHGILRYNTASGNSLDTGQGGDPDCGEFHARNAENVTYLGNLGFANNPNGCYGDPYNPTFGARMRQMTSTSTVAGNWFGNLDGTNFTSVQLDGESATTFNFAYGANLTGDPQFANPAMPAAPNCSGKLNVFDCMSAVIAGFTPQNVAAKPYGVQPVPTTNVYDPLEPQWLCSVTNWPTGMGPLGCAPIHKLYGTVSRGAIQR